MQTWGNLALKGSRRVRQGRRCGVRYLWTGLFRRCVDKSSQWFAAACPCSSVFRSYPGTDAKHHGLSPPSWIFCNFGQSASPPKLWRSGVVSADFPGRPHILQIPYQKVRRRFPMSASVQPACHCLQIFQAAIDAPNSLQCLTICLAVSD